MTGTGTSENPYIIMTPADLYAMEELGGSEVCFALGGDIDLSSADWHEDFRPIPLNCCSLEGNGHSIRNIIAGKLGGEICLFAIPSGITAVSVTGLSVENAVIRGMRATIFRAAGICSLELENCTFIYMMTVISNVTGGDEDGTFASRNLTVDMTYCTVAAKYVWNQQRGFCVGGSISQSQFRMDIESSRMTAAVSAAWAFFRATTISDTCFFIELRDPLNSTAAKTLRIAYTDTAVSNCYYVIHSAQPITVYIGGNLGSVCFYDSGSLGAAAVNKGYTDNSFRLLGLTTEQCKSAGYLRSVGFVCGGET